MSWNLMSYVWTPRYVHPSNLLFIGSESGRRNNHMAGYPSKISRWTSRYFSNRASVSAVEAASDSASWISSDVYQ